MRKKCSGGQRKLQELEIYRKSEEKKMLLKFASADGSQAARVQKDKKCQSFDRKIFNLI